MPLRIVTPLVCVSLALACAGVREVEWTAGRPALTGRGADSVIDRPTPSAALDRITKRRPDLDGVVRHAGTGRGTTIYVFDGGIAAAHPELAGRVRAGFDAFPATAHICNPHGTAVAGAAAGATLGVATAAEIVDVKIINCDSGHGTVQAILDAARWVADDQRLHDGRVAVANWSFIVDTTRVVPEIDSALTILDAAGVLVVASAGNFDIDACKVWPANANRALIVGASTLRRSSDTRLHDLRTQHTAFGRCVDLYAPGDSVPLPSVDGDKPIVQYWSGTSMAAGYVSGAAALLLEAHPLMDARTLRRAIETGATTDVVDDDRLPPGEERGRLLYIGEVTPRVIAAAPSRRPR